MPCRDRSITPLSLVNTALRNNGIKPTTIATNSIALYHGMISMHDGFIDDNMKISFTRFVSLPYHSSWVIVADIPYKFIASASRINNRYTIDFYLSDPDSLDAIVTLAKAYPGDIM